MKIIHALLIASAVLLCTSCAVQLLQQGAPHYEGCYELTTGSDWRSAHIPVTTDRYTVEEEVVTLTSQLSKSLSRALFAQGLQGYIYMTRGGERMLFTDNMKKVPAEGRIVGFAWETKFHFRQVRRYCVTDKESGKLVCSFNAALVSIGGEGKVQESFGELLWNLSNPGGVELDHESYFCTPTLGSKLQLPKGESHVLTPLKDQ